MPLAGVTAGFCMLAKRFFALSLSTGEIACFGIVSSTLFSFISSCFGAFSGVCLPFWSFWAASIMGLSVRLQTPGIIATAARQTAIKESDFSVLWIAESVVFPTALHMGFANKFYQAGLAIQRISIAAQAAKRSALTKPAA